MQMDLEVVRLLLEDRVPELKPPEKGHLIIAILLLGLSLVVNSLVLVGFVYLWSGEISVTKILFWNLAILALCFLVGRFLNGTQSELGKAVIAYRHSPSLIRQFSFGGSGKHYVQSILVGFLIMAVQFVVFGTYACLEEIRIQVASGDDVRSRVAAGIVAYVLEQGEVSREQISKQLLSQGIGQDLITNVLDTLEERTILTKGKQGLVVVKTVASFFGK